MVKLYDLEDHIMKCWNITSDIDDIYQHIMEHIEYGKLDSDEMSNLMLGLKSIYDIKFSHLLSTYEALIREQHVPD